MAIPVTTLYEAGYTLFCLSKAISFENKGLALSSGASRDKAAAENRPTHIYIYIVTNHGNRRFYPFFNTGRGILHSPALNKYRLHRRGVFQQLLGTKHRQFQIGFTSSLFWQAGGNGFKLPTMNDSTTINPPASLGYPMLRALICGIIVAVPAGWLYSYLAFLPAFMGVFFVFLMGLIIGAVMYRAGRSCSKPSVAKMLVVSLSVTFITIATGLFGEYAQLAPTVSERLLGHLPRVLGPEEKQHLKQQTAEHIRTSLQQAYPPGGIFGYVQWAADEGILKCPRVVMDKTYEFRLSQRGTIWIIRVALSFILLAGAILSQFLVLRRSKPLPADQPQSPETTMSKMDESASSPPTDNDCPD